ncbi:Lipase 1 [Grifola frondosa]|uniref:Carboxylic ester hydrolase n=1 Tax=Grifola frondosa TaxID=5627 RepID=A0A1C7MGG0_GRIFR|nr:Lipase 1 [Grifola frondosa]
MRSLVHVPLFLLSGILTQCGALHLPSGRSTNLAVVSLDDGTFVGVTEGHTTKFLGIPYAKAPIGDLRFNLPVAVDPYAGTYDATSFGPACPQQIDVPEIAPWVNDREIEELLNITYDTVSIESEDCLSVNVLVPTEITSGASLPVVAWILGGGFETGSTLTFDGGVVVQRSIELDEPVIYVSMNYRVTAFGFLASQEVKDAGVGNLGLRDQRLALRWIQKYIGAFGGDPTKVTIWGESAGAISVALQMITNGGDTEGLFRGAFMQSGGPIPVGDITNGQADYDALVSQTGCTNATDTLQCLRHAPYDVLKLAMDRSPGLFSYQSLKLAWLPRVDGVFLTDLPQNLTLQGKIANIPYVTGNCDDEGTLFSLSTFNITNEADLREYFISNYVNGAEESDVDEIFTLYPADPTQGSPFGTGTHYNITAEYKRLAALNGDLIFQAPRRILLNSTAERQPAWSFQKSCSCTFAAFQAHGTDLIGIYIKPGDLADYLINFVNKLDPNGNTPLFTWPQYDTKTRQLLTLTSGGGLGITVDTYRAAGITALANLSLQFPL